MPLEDVISGVRIFILLSNVCFLLGDKDMEDVQWIRLLH